MNSTSKRGKRLIGRTTRWNTANSVVDTQDVQTLELPSFFQQIREMREHDESGQALNSDHLASPKIPTVGLVFLEPSTRTLCSFQQAAHKLGFRSLVLQGGSKDGNQGGSNGGEHTSLAKGETLEDTAQQVAAMGVDGLVIRAPGSFEIKKFIEGISCPVINAGWGSHSHPTQALLDAFTIFDELGSVKDQNILIVGDVKHSRCASSQMELFHFLGAKVGVCCPDEFKPSADKVKTSWQDFTDLKEGLQWADVVIALRVQKERHSQIGWSLQKYIDSYQVSAEALRFFKEDGLLMAPGPVNWGVELNQNVQDDQRSRILRQVYNGVFVRAALLQRWVQG